MSQEAQQGKGKCPVMRVQVVGLGWAGCPVCLAVQAALQVLPAQWARPVTLEGRWGWWEPQVCWAAWRSALREFQVCREGLANPGGRGCQAKRGQAWSELLAPAFLELRVARRADLAVKATPMPPGAQLGPLELAHWGLVAHLAMVGRQLDLVAGAARVLPADR